MDEYDKFLTEGIQFLKAAQGKDGKPSKLAADIRYNLLALSLEKCMMAILLYNHDMADNHTFTDLLNSVVRHVEIPPVIANEIAALEQVQSICNVYEYHREIPSDIVVARLASVALYIKDLATGICHNKATSSVNSATAPVA